MAKDQETYLVEIYEFPYRLIKFAMEELEKTTTDTNQGKQWHFDRMSRAVDSACALISTFERAATMRYDRKEETKNG